MAKMKTKTKTQTKVKTAKNVKMKKAIQTAVLPDGYAVIGRPQNWNPDTNPIITGVRGETHEVVMDKGTKKERTQRNFVLQEDDLGAITIWESSMLKQFFDETEDGDQVRIEFIGLGEPKKGMQPPKLFVCGIKR